MYQKVVMKIFRQSIAQDVKDKTIENTKFDNPPRLIWVKLSYKNRHFMINQLTLAKAIKNKGYAICVG